MLVYLSLSSRGGPQDLQSMVKAWAQNTHTHIQMPLEFSSQFCNPGLPLHYSNEDATLSIVAFHSIV